MVLEKEVSIVRHVDIPEASIKVRSDTIIHVHYKKNTILDVELQNRMRLVYQDITNGKRMKFIFTADDGFVLTKEARENAPVLEEDLFILHYAVVANNLAYRIIANFYFKVVRPKVNYKLFRTFDAAIKWLKVQ